MLIYASLSGLATVKGMNWLSAYILYVLIFYVAFMLLFRLICSTLYLAIYYIYKKPQVSERLNEIKESNRIKGK